MNGDLGGPRKGCCHVTKSTGRPTPDGGFDATSREDLGVMAWIDLIGMVEKTGGTRPTYDLFDVIQGDGIVARYRAVGILGEPS